MIRELTLHNFLSHEESILKFDKGVNIIVGPSDSGKSAIIRALRWVIQNRPSGDFMRSYWGGNTEVRVDFSNGQVSRIRTDKDNMYLLGMHDEFRAVRTDVPEEIAQLINMNEINLQTQFESHFLLSSSSGEVAAYFNKIAHLDKIDVGLRNLQKWTKEVQYNINRDSDALLAVGEELEKYSDLHKLEEEVVRLEKLESLILEKEMDVVDVYKIVTQLEVIEEEIGRRLGLLSMEKDVLACFELMNSVDEARNSYAELEGLWIKIGDIQNTLEEIEDILGAEKEVNRVIVIDNEIKDVERNYRDLKRAYEEVVYLDENLHRNTVKQAGLQKEYSKFVGEECPVCGGVIK